MLIIDAPILGLPVSGRSRFLKRKHHEARTPHFGALVLDWGPKDSEKNAGRVASKIRRALLGQLILEI